MAKKMDANTLGGKDLAAGVPLARWEATNTTTRSPIP